MESYRNKTGYRGVRKTPQNRFTVNIKLQKKRIHLGVYDTAEEAVEVYDAFYLKYKNKQEKYCTQARSKNTKGIRKDNRTGYRGVDNINNKFIARSYHNYKRIHLGTYDTAAEAAIIVNKYLNSIDDNGLRNDIPINEIIEIERIRKKKQKEFDKWQEEKDMNRLKIKNYKHGPEWKIQQKVIKYLEDRNWYVRILHGNVFQAGLTDLVAFHKRFGIRFIEIKNPKSYHFTASQLKEFPKIVAHGTPVYILCAANDENYQRLFGPGNLAIYVMKQNYGK